MSNSKIKLQRIKSFHSVFIEKFSRDYNNIFCVQLKKVSEKFKDVTLTVKTVLF